MSIDSYAEHLQNMIMGWIPTSIIPYLLQFIVTCKIVWAAFSHQAIVTGKAIYHSFSNPIYLFHKVNNTYVLNVCNSRTRQTTMTPHEWEYNPKTKQFLSHHFSENDTTYSIPYLGASVSYNLNGTMEQICDMSEWISEQKIVAPNNNLPLQVLVGTYLYLARNMKIYDYTNYVLHVTDDMAEDFTYDISSGNIIHEGEGDDDNTSTKASEVSTADSASSSSHLHEMD
jgi:hypothetical protein